MWRLQSPPLPGDGPGAMRHTVMLELSSTGSGFGATGIRGGTGDLPCRVRSLALWGWT
jgi:hypothetical protein